MIELHGQPPARSFFSFKIFGAVWSLTIVLTAKTLIIVSSEDRQLSVNIFLFEQDVVDFCKNLKSDFLITGQRGPPGPRGDLFLPVCWKC